MKEIQIPIPSLEEQKEIIKELEREQKIINCQKQSIELLKEKRQRRNDFLISIVKTFDFDLTII